MKLLEKTPAVRSERSRASGAVEEQATSGPGSLRLRCATLRPNGKDSTASEEVYESSVVRFSKLFSILYQISLTCSALRASLAWFEHNFERDFLTFALSDKCYTGNPDGQAWRFSGYFRNPRAGDCVALQEEKCVARRPLVTATGWQ